MSDFIYNPPQSPYLNVIYKDKFLIVVNKPGGLLSVPGRLPLHHDSIVTRVRKRFGYAEAVHRLDMDTSGLLIVSLCKETTSALGKLFIKKQVCKYYLALVAGDTAQEGELSYPIRCNLQHRPLQIVDYMQGKKALTKFVKLPLQGYIAPSFEQKLFASKISLVKLIPVTGRSHQLRLHMQSYGTPIIGDRFYGSDMEKGINCDLCLHASFLAFYHPFTNRHLIFKSTPSFLKELPL